MNRKWLALLMTGSLLTGAGGSYAVTTWMETDQKEAAEASEKDQTEAESDQSLNEKSMEKVAQAYKLIQGNYVEKVDEDKLVEGAIQGMLSVLKDPYSVYMDKETAEQFTQTLESSFEGIGAEIGIVDGKIVIVSPFKNSPAEKAGIKPNDQILKVDGESVEGLDLNKATLKIRGKKGTLVTLELARKGLKEPMSIDVKRDEIPQITVHSVTRRIW